MGRPRKSEAEKKVRWSVTVSPDLNSHFQKLKSENPNLTKTDFVSIACSRQWADVESDLVPEMVAKFRTKEELRDKVKQAVMNMISQGHDPEFIYSFCQIRFTLKELNPEKIHKWIRRVHNAYHNARTIKLDERKKQLYNLAEVLYECRGYNLRDVERLVQNWPDKEHYLNIAKFVIEHGVPKCIIDLLEREQIVKPYRTDSFTRWYGKFLSLKSHTYKSFELKRHNKE